MLMLVNIDLIMNKGREIFYQLNDCTSMTGDLVALPSSRVAAEARREEEDLMAATVSGEKLSMRKEK